MPSQPASKNSPSLDTLSIHAGQPRKKAHDSLPTPIVFSSTYAFEDTAELRSYFDHEKEREEYGRYGNPTVRAAEEKIAALEQADDCVLFASGMNAVTTTLLAILKSGDHLVLTNDCYRGTRNFVANVLSRFGITATLVPPGDFAGIEAAIQPGKTKLLITESPTNPYLRVADLPKLAAIRDRTRVKLLIDSTFATPVNQQPLTLGADLVLHSCTKYFGGHNDLMAGAVCGKGGLIQALKDFRGVLGGVLDPQSAFLLLRGLKTLPLRVRHQNQSAQAAAEALEKHPGVARVHYPGLESHPDHAVAKASMRGFGAVVSFELKAELEQSSRFIDACRLATLAPSLGGTETLIEQPALMSFYELTSEQRAAIGIKENLIRLSVGLEGVDEVIADLYQALEAAGLGTAEVRRVG